MIARAAEMPKRIRRGRRGGIAVIGRVFSVGEGERLVISVRGVCEGAEGDVVVWWYRVCGGCGG